MRPKILHVSEAFGGGIVSSLYSFAQNTPEAEHHLLITERKAEPLSLDLSTHFATISPLRSNLLGAVADIKRKDAELNPRFVHLHSSFAGFYGRVAGLDSKKLIYSPHGFAFQRQSSSYVVRQIYGLVERLLSHRAASFAGVSLDEVRLSLSFNSGSRSVFVPNTTNIETLPPRSPKKTGPIDIVCMGRLCPQKDPDFLLRILSLLSPEDREQISFTWIGAGDSKMSEALKAVGVTVTGWMSHSQANRRLAEADLYLHVAAWEGFPMTVIEAAALGLPILVRYIPAFEGFSLPSNAMLSSPHEAAERLAQWAVSPESRTDSYALADAVRNICSRDRQRAALQDLYGIETA